MDKVTAADNSANIAGRVSEDIPIAQRETPPSPVKPTLNKGYLIAGVVAVSVVAAGAGAFASFQLQRSRSSTASLASVVPDPTPAAVSPVPTVSTVLPSPDAGNDSILGHFKYAEAPLSALVPIVPDGSIKLRKTAAQAYREMEASARSSGVVLAPISGFRSLSDQDYLFFGKKAERGQEAAERAKVSAPPGYSEHHTGYAIDIGDGNAPATNLSESFENTAAFRWLKANAAYHSFEISFPKGNKQGVSYEPWHWRYVGDRHSLETFYKARSRR